MEYVFGPVPSRRLGRSLGIDPIPFKTCNWNCVYCQLGRTTPLAHERRDYVPPDEVVDQVRRALEEHGPDGVDWVTFGGSGEPTLHASLGRMVRELKALTSLPVAVLTNGALLYRFDVRQDLLAADAVLPTLDAGSEALYWRINRPWPGLTFDRLVEGLLAFAGEYRGQLWVEVMLVKGLNDTEEALEDLAAVLSRIDPDEVHLNQPVRPPAEPWVEPPGEEALARAVAVLGRKARIVGPARACVELPARDDAAEAVLGILARHPLDLDGLVRALDGWSAVQVGEALATLLAGGRVRTVDRGGRRFWSGAEARYGR